MNLSKIVVRSVPFVGHLQVDSVGRKVSATALLVLCVRKREYRRRCLGRQVGVLEFAVRNTTKLFKRGRRTAICGSM